MEQALAKGVTPRAMVVINPGNPTGQCLDPANMQQVRDRVSCVVCRVSCVVCRVSCVVCRVLCVAWSCAVCRVSCASCAVCCVVVCCVSRVAYDCTRWRQVIEFCHRRRVLLMADEVYQANSYIRPFTSFKKVPPSAPCPYSRARLYR